MCQLLKKEMRESNKLTLTPNDAIACKLLTSSGGPEEGGSGRS